MADAATPTVGMSFDLSVDTKPFEEGLAAAAKSYGGLLDEITKRSLAMYDAIVAFNQALETALDPIYEDLKKAWTGGPDSIESVTVSTLEKTQKAASDMLDNLVDTIANKLGPRVGAAMKSIWSGLKSTISDYLDDISKKAADTTASWVEANRAGLEDTLAKTQLALSHLKDVYRDIGSSMAEAWSKSSNGLTGFVNAMGAIPNGVMKPGIVEADEYAASVEEARKKLAGLTRGLIDFRDSLVTAEQFKPLLDAMDEKIKQQERQLQLIGKSAGEQTRLKAGWASDDAIAKLESETSKTVTDEQKTNLQAKVEAEVAAAQKIADAQKAVRDAQQIASSFAGIDRQAADWDARTDAIARQAKGLGVVQAASAEARAEASFMQMAQRNHIPITEELSAVLEDHKKKLGAAAQAYEQAKASFDLEHTLKTQVRLQKESGETLGMTAGQAAAFKFELNELDKLTEKGIPVTQEWTDRISASAKAIKAATDATSDLKEKFQLVMGVGQTMASTLETAFSNFTKGTANNWQNLFQTMMHQIEMLIIRMAIIQPLFGGGASGSGALGQLFSSLAGGGTVISSQAGSASNGGFSTTTTSALSSSLFSGLGSLFSGARASGGPVDGGQTYLVGENGPELFKAPQSGSIVPNSALGSSSGGGGSGGAAPVTVNVHAPDGTTARTQQTPNGSGGMNIDVLIEHIDAALGQKANEGSSVLGNAMSQRYGLNAGFGAR